MRWAGEHGAQAALSADAVASICSPLDLTASGKAIGRGFNRQVYTRMFLRTMKPKALAKLAQHPGLFDRQKLLAARDLYEFDNVFTSPLHGFRNTDDYWRRASAKAVMASVGIPALALNACNDPFVPASSLPTQADVSSHVTLWQPRHGGHVGLRKGACPDMCVACPMPSAAGCCRPQVRRLHRRFCTMDDIVRQAMSKWPNVPACVGWLALDSRGQWHMRDDRVQALGAFQSGVPGAKGSVLRHENSSTSSSAITKRMHWGAGIFRTGRSAFLWSSKPPPGSGDWMPTTRRSRTAANALLCRPASWTSKDAFTSRPRWAWVSCTPWMWGWLQRRWRPESGRCKSAMRRTCHNVTALS